MRVVSIREMRAALPRLEELVRREGELLITRHGRPVARVLPLRGARDLPSHAALRGSMPPLSVSSAELVRQERDGR